jgi:hypothetical protein
VFESGQGPLDARGSPLYNGFTFKDGGVMREDPAGGVSEIKSFDGGAVHLAHKKQVRILRFECKSILRSRYQDAFFDPQGKEHRRTGKSPENIDDHGRTSSGTGTCKKASSRNFHMIFLSGCWFLDAGFWMLVSGCWMLDTRCLILDPGLFYAAILDGISIILSI